ncbi:MAG: isocitrate/isopropylmalate dehydrogenase family protein [Nitrosopumilus sp.]|uniref:isocitrate/isopropylmalate dehydrogenase family protein n=1 Tax=Nitrosopumilus sp. TaxID=2024843 RepID=UPI00246E48A2|nr:isocitrate/isopropylmalate dehydrogenase family protein [Nitrosopumilus sp.]MDH5431905.1 isocitrate/isopropylmalate dehydrogenase family protein [Nitrosopumilus sp.]
MYKISLITGDGIGPELSESVLSVLNAIHDRLDLKFNITKLSAGDKALSETGKALPDETVTAIKQSDACMKAPVGESAADVIVVLRRMLDLYANIRPAKSYPHMPALRDDIDMVIVRENTEDLYTGKEFSLGNASVALRIISEAASKRIAKYAFETAKQRDSMRKVTCVHKSNVMRVTDGMFAKACVDVSKDYPDIAFEEMYVDACAMNLIRQPEQFDVVVTTNLFGDILSDESSQVVGGLGMAPAANIGDDFALFEPVHGAAFDIAGQNIANPSSFLLSIKMMLDWLGNKHNDSKCIGVGAKLESTIFDLVKSGVKTKDIGGTSSTTEFTKQITDNL